MNPAIVKKLLKLLQRDASCPRCKVSVPLHSFSSLSRSGTTINLTFPCHKCNTDVCVSVVIKSAPNWHKKLSQKIKQLKPSQDIREIF